MNDSLNGDAESQYFLFRILSECGLNSENIISHALSTYEILGIPLNLAHIKEVENEVSKCSGFTKNNFSYFYKKSRYEWLKKSADNKYPIAMAAYAKEAIWTLRGDLSFMPKTDFTFKSASGMLFQSIKLDEPATFIEVAQIVENIPDQTAWGLLACRMGYNCKGNNFNFENSIIVMTCLTMTKETDCFEKANFHFFLTLGLDEETIKAAISRSFEIENKLKNNDYQGIGLDTYLDYIKVN